SSAGIARWAGLNLRAVACRLIPMRHVHAALLASILCFSTAECGMQLPAIATVVANAVGEAAIYLGKLVEVANLFFQAHPDPALQKTVNDDVANTQAAMAALQADARGVADGSLTLADLKTTFEAFKTAWDKM